jgi:hypothetical protein
MPFALHASLALAEAPLYIHEVSAGSLNAWEWLFFGSSSHFGI